MENTIIEFALLSPAKYPWTNMERIRDNVTKEEVDKILKEKSLINIIDRSKAILYIEACAYKAAIGKNNDKNILEDLENTISKSKYSYVNKEVLFKILRRRKLIYKEKIMLLNDLINNKVNMDKLQAPKDLILIWIIDLTISSYLSQNKDFYNLENLIVEIIKERFNEFDFESKDIKSIIGKKGFHKYENLKIISEEFYGKDFNFLDLPRYEEKAKQNSENINQDIDLESSLFDMLEEIDLDLVHSKYSEKEDKKEKIEEKSSQKISTKEDNNICKNNKTIQSENIDSQKDKIEKSKKEESLKELSKKANKEEEKDLLAVKKIDELANLYGYKLVPQNSELKNKEIREDKDVSLIKNLLDFENGAVLSELYNLSKKIDLTSKENISAVIENLFSYLEMLGFEAVEEGSKVGDIIEVNTKDALKEFKFISPVDKDGLVKGEIVYLPWTSKGEKITYKIIKPVE